MKKDFRTIEITRVKDAMGHDMFVLDILRHELMRGDDDPLMGTVIETEESYSFSWIHELTEWVGENADDYL